MNKLTDPDTIKFTNLLNTFSLEKFVNTSTHRLGNTLDLIITDSQCLEIQDVTIDSSYTLGGDHSVLHFNVLCNIESCVRKPIKYRNFKQVNIPDFNADILMDTNKYLLEANNTNFLSCVNSFNNLYSATVDKHAPIVITLANISNRPPCMDNDFRAARRERRILFKTWKKKPTIENRYNFEQSRLSVDSLAKDKKRSFYQSSIKSSSNSQKELFKICNTLLDTSKTSILPYSENHFILADKFNNYFVEKIEKIRTNLDSDVVSVHSPVDHNISTLSNFNSVSSETLLKQIKSSKIKTSQNDPIPAFLLRTSVELLVPSILHLVNTSLQTGSTDGVYCYTYLEKVWIGSRSSL